MRIQFEGSKPRIGRIKIARLQNRARTFHLFPITRPRQAVVAPTSEPETPGNDLAAVEDHSPAARARRARQQLNQRFKAAKGAAKGQARLRRADEYELLRCAYVAVRCWQRDGIAKDVERELRAEAQVAISRASSLFLVLLRSALPHLDAKRASKWAAALEIAEHKGVRAERLRAFLRNTGGIEGAARQRAKLRADLNQANHNE